MAKGDLAVSLQRFYHYAGIPIRYPPCGPGVFAVDDEVFVLFEGTNRDQPVIIGSGANPKPALDGKPGSSCSERRGR